MPSAVVVEVPEAEPLVGAWRLRFDPVAALGMPAHVTLLYPFVAPSASAPMCWPAWLPAPHRCRRSTIRSPTSASFRRQSTSRPIQRRRSSR